MNRHLIFFIFLFQIFPYFSYSTEWPNESYIKITIDSILIKSTPYCKFGNYGQTKVYNMHSNQLLYSLNYYVKPSSRFSKDGNYRVDFEYGFTFYYRDSLIKYYNIDELIPVFPKDGDILFNGMSYSSINKGWIIEEFFLNHIFYALLLNGNLIRIDITKEKLSVPISFGTILMDSVYKLKNQSDSTIYQYDENQDDPEKDQICTKSGLDIENSIKKIIEEITNDKFYLLIAISYEDCKPRIIEFDVSLYPIYLYIREDRISHDNPTVESYYQAITNFINTTGNIICNIDKDIGIWAFAYTIPINQ